MQNKTKTRHRIREVKKWSKSEVIKVLDYILQSETFEKPTAQVYYNKLIAETKVEATWDMLRWKMRNLRVSFQKCSDWLMSTEAKMLEAEQGFYGITSKIQKMCPHYENLRQIYAEKSETAVEEVSPYESNTFLVDELVCIKSEHDGEPPPTPSTTTNSAFLVYDSAAASSPTISTCAMDDDSGVTITPAIITTGATITPTTTTTTKSVKAATTTDACTDHQESSSSLCALKELSKLQSQRNCYYDKKIQMQQNKIDKDFLIEERKIKLEEAKLKLEEEKFRANLELRKEELAKDERIAKFEIEMKYKYKN